MSIFCKVPGCDLKVDAKGFCQKHYKRYKQGDNPFHRSLKDPNEIIIKENYIKIKLYSKHNDNLYGYVDLEHKDTIEDIIKNNVINCSNAKSKNKYMSYSITKNNKRTSRALVYHLFGELEDDYIYTYRNGNGLDLRKENIEIISTIEHSRRLAVQNKKHKAPGISKNKHGKWIVTISTDGKSLYLGSFDNEDDAANARIAAEEKYWGKVYTIL